jgi:hypothetical protein
VKERKRREEIEVVKNKKENTRKARERRAREGNKRHIREENKEEQVMREIRKE